MQRGLWITDSIELSEPIGEGAMGRVWVGYHHLLGTKVAIKFVSDKLGEDTAEAMARFEREASVAAQIKSPHVVRTFASGLTRNNVPYIVMELLHGESLGDRLRQVGRIDLEEATIVLQHTAEGLTQAHALGVVHRDIKPDNIFLCRSDDGLTCKVLDFGIAKQTLLPAMGGLTTEGKLVGTPEYMSPENVLEDRVVDHRADLWSLAVVMYQAITGHLPFTGATLGQLCLNLVGKAPPKITQYRHDLPRRVDSWFARALNRDVGMRFTSASQMAESFATLDDEQAFHLVEINETTERHLSSSITPPRASARKPNNLVTGAGVGAAMLALAAGSWFLVQQPTQTLILAQQALAPITRKVANRAVNEAGKPKPKPEASASVAAAPEPVATSAKKRPRPSASKRRQPTSKKRSPKPAPVDTSAGKQGRTPGNTGF